MSAEQNKPSALLTSAGKEALRKTIRGLRESLIAQLQEAAEREYRLGVPMKQAQLPEERQRRRERLEAWADAQSRAESATQGGKGASRRQRYLDQAVQEAAHTLINRLVILRLLEAGGLSQPRVVTGGWKSPGYREFQDYAAALCTDASGSVTVDETKGYAALLQLLFDELAVELPGVFGKVGLTSLFPVPAATLREVVEALNSPELDSAWQDDTTLGWVYQFWNDPEREALDDKINGGGKIEPHEIASKTQMFTERYMVEWLLHNSLGQTWLAMCKKNGWAPDFEQVRESLEARRADWRKQREAGEVAADALMPIESALEGQWKYWVPQPLPEDAPAAAPGSLRELKLLDPACGSGHFLVIAFDLLGALYQEEARHWNEAWSDEQIAQWIVADNLHGIDIDPRALQIAAAALWLKARVFAPKARITRMNLVAPTFQLAALPGDDPALVRLQARLRAEVGIPEAITQQLVEALNGVDHLGTLLRVDTSIRKELAALEGLSVAPAQGNLFASEAPERMQLSLDDAMSSVMTQLGKFLDAHEGESDLGLRLEGQQLAAGVRFLQIAQEGRYDVVVGNPPYQGTSKMTASKWFAKHYPRAKADLYACFLERGLELAKPGGVSAQLSMRGWMFLSSYQTMRERILAESDLRVLCDIDKGGFEHMATSQLISVALTVQRNVRRTDMLVPALQPTAPGEKYWDRDRTPKKRADVLAQRGRFEFDVAKLSGIEGTPLVYWWDEDFLNEYIQAPKLGEVAPVKFGVNTGDNGRFTRVPWEVSLDRLASRHSPRSWVPFILGGKGRAWWEGLRLTLDWADCGLALKVSVEHKFGSAGVGWKVCNSEFYFRPGVAFSMIGSSFAVRAHRFPSIIGNKGSSAFPDNISDTLCGLNSSKVRSIIQSLNPGIGTEVGDVNRAPGGEYPQSRRIVETTVRAFTTHESHREPSVEFKSPGPSPWRYAQDWAQRAVDRPKGEPLPPYEEELDAPEPTDFVSFALGVALGRFGQDGEGILDLSLPPAKGTATPSPKPPASAPGASQHPDPNTPAVPDITPSPLPQGQSLLPAGTLFLSAAPNVPDSLSDPAAARMEDAWATHSSAILNGKKTSLRDWLRKDFFAYHKGLYENRPIYFPLSSSAKSFVAFVSIHRWADNTLQALLANHLHPARESLQGQINDLNEARASSDKKQRASAEKQYAKSQKLFEELEQFIADVTQCAERGAPPTDAKCPEREVDAPFAMDLDDGVMINSAALWPLLTPQWKDPKKWWKELCTATGRKDYDWAHLSARYFPTRVDKKCQADPSLGVAHGCFWKYHPAKAHAWELRLQDEIAPNFTIDEPGSNEARQAFLTNHPKQAAENQAKEEKRRQTKRKKAQKSADQAPSDKFELSN